MLRTELTNEFYQKIKEGKHLKESLIFLISIVLSVNIFTKLKFCSVSSKVTFTINVKTERDKINAIQKNSRGCSKNARFSC